MYHKKKGNQHLEILYILEDEKRTEENKYNQDEIDSICK